MPYKNIVWAKLEKRLLNDPRWYMLSEKAQLNFIKFILFAQETYNKCPSNLHAIKLAFKTNQTEICIKHTIEEIQKNFPKFKKVTIADNEYYCFDGFEEKTNYLKEGIPQELPSKSQVFPKEGIEENRIEEKRKEYKDTSNEVKLSNLLLTLIQSRLHKFKKPNIKKWSLHIDYLLRIDNRTPEEIERVIRWCQADSFWQSNILSTEKLRKQFDQLEAKMNQKGVTNAKGSSANKGSVKEYPTGKVVNTDS